MTAAVNWEFSVSINHTGGDRYYLKVENVPAGGILAEAQVSWAVEDWLERTRQLMNDPLQDILQGRDAGASQSLSSPDAKFAPNFVDLGQELYDALFQGTIRDSWLMAQAIAQHYRSVLRLRIGLRGSTLPRLPWEVMHYWNCPLAATTDVTFSRYQILSRALVSPRKSSLSPNIPLRILMVIATPKDQEGLELREEAEHLRSELKERFGSPLLDLTILEQPGREELTYALEHGNYHIFHYSGHSNLGSNGGNLFLVNNQNGLTETLNGNDLAGLLSNNGVQLVVFNSCRGAYTAATEVTSTTGNLTQSLINRGIPAVLAMSERIPDNVALTMTRLFYRNLNQGYPIDLSLSRARQGLISTYGSHQLYWALPVLYLHPEFDGFLWKTKTPPEGLQQVWELPPEESGFLGTELPSSSAISYSRMGLTAPSPLSLSSPELPRGSNPLDYLINADLERDSGDLSDSIGGDSQDPEASDRPLIAPEEMTNFFRNSRETVTFEGEFSPRQARKESAQNPQTHQSSNQLLNQSSNQKSPQKSNQKPGSSSTPPPKTKQIPLPGVPLVTRSPQELSPTPKLSQTTKNLGMAWLSTSILLGTMAGAGIWWHYQQPTLDAGKALPQAPSISPITAPINTPSFSPKEINLKTADVQAIVTLGSQYFQNSDIAAGRLAVEELLDRKAFKEAKTTLESVNPAQTENASLNFLRGRLAWQTLKTGSKDYTLEDVQKFWDAASKNQPDSVLYFNALGFSYYEAGDYSKAKDAWLKAFKILEVNSDPTTPPEKITPVAARDRLNTSAGLALVFRQLSDNLLRTERNRLLVESQNFYQQIIKEDGLNYQPEVLGRNWLWTEKTVRDWTILGK